MKTKSSKTFEDILKKRNYEVERGEPKNLSAAIDEYLSQNGAAWLSDIRDSLRSYLDSQYTLADMPYNARRLSRWEQKDNLSDEEISSRLEEKKSSYYRNKADISVANLRGLSEVGFKIDYIVPMLREKYCSSSEDNVEIRADVNESNFDAVKSKALGLNEKKLTLKDSFEDKQYAKQTKEKLDAIEIQGDAFDYNFRIPKNVRGEGRTELNIALLANMYEKIATHVPIVFNDLQKGLEFFEKETGINVSKPKESTTYMFGK